VVAVVVVLAHRAFDHSFAGDRLLMGAFVLGLFGFCAGHLTRGTLSSHRRFGGYARFFEADGVSRVALAALLAAVGVATAGPFGLVMAITPFIGVVAGLFRQGGLLEPGPEAPWSELTRNLGWLLLGTVSISLVVQGGTIAVDLLATPAEKAAGATGDFLNGLQTARIPLFLFQAILASLLPKLSRQAGMGEYGEFTAGLRRLVTAILALGVVATAAAGLLGPTAIRIVFGSATTLSGRDLALLAAAFIVIMATICLDQALIALHAHSLMAIGWAVALAVFVVVTSLGHSLFLRVELGLMAAALWAFGWMVVCLWQRLRHRVRADAIDLGEYLAELPIES
jgi:O-antigen/teichoic acid export membrane protein